MALDTRKLTDEELQRKLRILEAHKVAMEARDRFMPFVKYTSPDPEDPNDASRSKYKNARHHDAIARVIEEVVKNKIKFLILTMPPRHGKSELVSRRLPAWFIGKYPAWNVVVGTYGDAFAMDFGRDVRGIMRTPQYRKVFPGVALQRGGEASDRLQTTQGGQLTFVGRGGALTGRGAHLLILDDLIKDDKEAQSQAVRDQAWNWFTRVAMSRRMGPKLVIITFTRWHADDVIGRLIDPNNPNYVKQLAEKIKIINFPALAEEDDPLGREVGQALWPDGPDSFDEEFLYEQQALDPLGFSAIYQQRPSLMDGDLYKRADMRFYNPEDLPDNLRYYAASDHAVATGQRNDYTVLLHYGVDPQGNVYLVDCFWKKAKADIVVEAMLSMGTNKNKPLVWFAEKGHISKAIGPFLRKRMLETRNFMNVREVTPVGDKTQRAQSMVGRVAMGKLFFPKNALWTEAAIAEMLAFPNGLHDDFCDVLSIIGLTLQSQISPSTNDKQKTKEPEYGTLAWVRQMDKWADSKQRNNYGGF